MENTILDSVEFVLRYLDTGTCDDFEKSLQLLPCSFEDLLEGQYTPSDRNTIASELMRRRVKTRMTMDADLFCVKGVFMLSTPFSGTLAADNIVSQARFVMLGADPVQAAKFLEEEIQNWDPMNLPPIGPLETPRDRKGGLALRGRKARKANEVRKAKLG